MRGTAHPLNTQWPYVTDVPPPYRKILLLFTGELQTRRVYAFYSGIYIDVEFTWLIDDVFDRKSRSFHR